jgi:hypothetical protein
MAPARFQRMLLLVALLGFAAAARTLGIGHLSDDWAILGHLHRHGNAGAWAGPWLGMQTILFHRPVFTQLYEFELGLFGTLAWPAHLHHVLWHIAAGLLLSHLVLRLTGQHRAALLAAAAFLIYPLHAGAVGWLAARCGTVSATLGLGTASAWLSFRAGGRRRFAVLAAGLAGLAALTRESGYLALVTPAAIDLASGRLRPRAGRTLLAHCGFGALGAALFAIRWRALGTFAGGYPTPEGLVGGGMGLAEAAQALGRALLLLPGGMDPDFLATGWAGAAAAGAAALGLSTAGLLRAHSQGIRTGPALKALGLLLLSQILFLGAAGPVLDAATAQRWYGAFAIFVGLWSVTVAPLLGGASRWAPLAILPLWLLAHLGLQDQLVRADRGVKRLLAQTEELIAGEERIRASLDPPPPLGPTFVSCLPHSWRGLPTLQWGFAEALRPPFRPSEPASTIYPVHTHMFLGRDRAWPLHPPVEAMVHVQGRAPVALALANPFDAFDTRIQVADLGAAIQALGNRPQHWEAFARRGLRVIAPVVDPLAILELRGRPLSMPVRIDAAETGRVELFAFLPTVDYRQEAPLRDGIAELDLGPELEDYVAFRGTPIRIYLLAVGWRAEDPRRPFLSPLLTFDWRP